MRPLVLSEEMPSCQLGGSAAMAEEEAMKQAVASSSSADSRASVPTNGNGNGCKSKGKI